MIKMAKKPVKKEVPKEVEKESPKKIEKEVQEKPKKEVEKVREPVILKPKWTKELDARLSDGFLKHSWNELLEEFPFVKKEIQQRARELELY